MSRSQSNALEETEHLHKSTLDALSAHIAILDKLGAIVSVNTAWRDFARTNGMTWPRWGVGENYLKVCEAARGDETARAAAEGIQAVLTGKRDQFYLEYPCHSPIKKRWFILRAGPLKDNHRERLVIAHENITERKLAEQKMSSQQAELAYAGRLSMLGEMATGIAHEINQPLTAIYSYAQACIRRLSKDTFDPLELIESQEKISAAAQRAADVIRNLRAMATSKRKIRREVVSVNDLIKDVVTLACLDSRAQEIPIALDLEHSNPPVLVDIVQIQQVVLNLIRNGIDAMDQLADESKKLTIKTSRIKRNAIEISVSDSGSGIPEDVATQMFDPFFTTKSSGTGMGLTISDSILQAHNSRIRYVGNRDRGSKFWFTLPIASASRSS